MESLDPALEYLRLAERYRQMSDEEILVIAGARDELTEMARLA